MHLAIAYKRTDVVLLLLKRGAQIIDDIPFLEILDKLDQRTKLCGTYSYIKDDDGRIIYAEIESCSSGILTTLNIAFGVGDPKIANLILKHSKVSFIRNTEDNGIILHYECSGVDNEWKVCYTHHPYNYFYDHNKRLSRKDYIDYMDSLSTGGAGCLNHHIHTKYTPIADKRIGLLKQYINTPCRIAYMIMLNTLKNLQLKDTEQQNKPKIDTLGLMRRCITDHQLKLNDITKSISNLVEDGVVNKLQRSIKCCKRFKDEDILSIVEVYISKLFDCANEISSSVEICNQEGKKIKESINTTLSGINVQDVSVQINILIGRYG